MRAVVLLVAGEGIMVGERGMELRGAGNDNTQHRLSRSKRGTALDRGGRMALTVDELSAVV
jgi:hypothetical protein